MYTHYQNTDQTDDIRSFGNFYHFLFGLNIGSLEVSFQIIPLIKSRNLLMQVHFRPAGAEFLAHI